jgi:hypothetical protein
VGITAVSGGGYEIKISQFRHAAYAFTTPFTINYKALKSNYRATVCDIVSIPPPAVARPI